MTERLMTVQSKMMSVGDMWHGEQVVSVANSFRPTDADVTLFNPDTNRTRTVTFPREQWLQVTRDV